MITRNDPRRALYEGARGTFGPDAAAALIEILTCGPDLTEDATGRSALRKEIALLEREVASRRQLEQSMRLLRWVCVLSLLSLWTAILLTALVR